MPFNDTIQVKQGSFEGSLEHLVHLAQKKEIDLNEFTLSLITHAFIDNWEPGKEPYEQASDFILLAAQLAWLKSKRLLPLEPIEGDGIHIEDENDFSIIHHLIDYSRFKQAAVHFSKRESAQDAFFPRGTGQSEVRLPSGLTAISLDDLKSLFQDVLVRHQAKGGLIEEEEWRVQDKLIWLSSQLETHGELLFYPLFESARSKMEVIVLFLALLELLKMGHAKVAKRGEEVCIYGERI
jgi:segregation and condensation protein A